MAFALPAIASANYIPQWDVSGHYVTTFVFLGGTYPHTMNLSEDSSGNVTGSGGYPAGASVYQYSWHVTSGTVVGNTINLTILYDTGAAGTVMHMTGTIAADGTLSGNWDDNYGGTRNGTWSTTSGAANVTNAPDWGTRLSAASCAGKTGAPIINVTEKVTNDVDSGIAGNWAIDNYTRHIQVWQIGKNSNTYCALVTYEGTSNAQAGVAGPGGTGIIGSGVIANMQGGYRALFTGVLAPSPTWTSKGSVGTVNYGCNISGSCDTIPSWLNIYFTGVSNFTQPWWGWFYTTPSDGNWLNSIEGNFGNIL